MLRPSEQKLLKHTKNKPPQAHQRPKNNDPKPQQSDGLIAQLALDFAGISGISRGAQCGIVAGLAVAVVAAEDVHVAGMEMNRRVWKGEAGEDLRIVGVAPGLDVEGLEEEEEVEEEGDDREI